MKSALSITEVVETTGIGRTSVFALLKLEKLKARKVGRRTIILRTDLEDFLANLPSKS